MGPLPDHMNAGDGGWRVHKTWREPCHRDGVVHALIQDAHGCKEVEASNVGSRRGHDISARVENAHRGTCDSHPVYIHHVAGDGGREWR